MKRNQEMLETASYGKLILSLSIPTIIIMLVMIIYNMADTFFIGQTGDTNKVAAISLCAPIFSILSGLGTLFGSGGCTAISLALGKGEEDKIKATTSFCCYASLLLGFLFMSIVLTAAPAICHALGSDANTLDFTVGYLRIIAIGAPFILFNNVFANIIRADGSAAKSMVSNLIGTFTNIALDALFIMVFHWDVAGAAIATVFGNVVSSFYLFFYITKKQPLFSLNPKHLHLKLSELAPVISLGLPMACSTLLMSLASMISNKMMVSYGNAALAAQGIAGKIGMLITMLSMGICMGFQPAISYNCGKRNWKRMYQIIKNTGIFTFAVGMTLTIVCFFTRNQLIASFIKNDDVIAIAQIMVIANLLTGPVYGFYQLCQTFLQSTGKASYATIVAFLDKGIIFLPVLFLLNHFYGMYGIAFTGCVTLMLSLLIGIFFSLRWNRTLHQ